jgi:hypothetical protein
MFFIFISKAKFSAESAIGVGKETTAFVLQSDGSRYLIYSSEMPRIKNIWEATRGPDVAEGAEAIASELLTAAKARYKKVREE